jgi:AcrR family transcriptional regulator
MASAPSRTSDKRSAIVRAALELFAERSFDGTPMPLIARRAGVGAGTLYRYFASKEALGNAVYRECKAAMNAALFAAVPADLSPRQHFGHLWRALASFAAEQPAAFRFLELQHHEDYLDPESRAASTALSAGVAEFLRGAQAAGGVRAGPAEERMALALGAFVGLVREAGAGRFRLDGAAMTRAEDAVWALLAHPGGREEEP